MTSLPTHALFGFLVALLTLCSAISRADISIERVQSAVVKIHTTAAAPDYFNPWSLMNPSQSSGSGTVIDGQRILTNAHVVADSVYIQAQRNGDPDKYIATVEFVSHEADLAILKVENPDFFKGLKPLKFGGLPAPLTEVSVFGYPIGGNSLSITKGILSRVEHQQYAHAHSYLLAGQIDAAINPGNSGGPVIVDGNIVGVVMQANSAGRAENLGYFVPPSVIEHVMQDAKDNNHSGFPSLGFQAQGLESPAMKAAYQLDDSKSGVLVTQVLSDSPAATLLQTGDVIISIDGYDIADDQTIAFQGKQRTDFKYAIDQHHIGDSVDLTFIRSGKPQAGRIDITRSARDFDLVIGQRFDQKPEYYIYGGVVFVPLNLNLLKRWGRDWRNKAPVSFLAARQRWSSPEQQELIVALKVLPADVNLGYHDWKNWVIHSVNDTPIRDFKHFTQLLGNTQAERTLFKDERGYQMVIDHQQALTSEKPVLELYRIPDKAHLHID